MAPFLILLFDSFWYYCQKFFVLNKQLQLYSIATIWFLISLVLLVLPGSQFPTSDWLDGLHADKFIHIFLFFVLVFLYAKALATHTTDYNKLNIRIAVLFLLTFGYGIVMEFVQKNWVANRSFDVLDIVADGIGSLLAAVWQIRKKKK